MIRLPIILLSLMLGSSLCAQDIILLKDGKEVRAKVKSVGTSEIKYHDFENLTGPEYSIEKNMVFMITYENGKKDVFSESPSTTIASTKAGPCEAGTRDAELYHRRTGTHVILGVLTGPFAAIGAALSHPTPERGRETMAKSKNKEYFQVDEYRECYQKKARSKNVVNSLAGWGSWIIFVIAF